MSRLELYPWQGSEQDGYADTIESALYLLNRMDVPEAARWTNRQAGILFGVQADDGRVEDRYLDGNFVLTALLYAASQSGGTRLEPRSASVPVGAERDGACMAIVIATGEDWNSRLVFDGPRHATNLRLPLNYPRLNEWPEWFAVQAGASYHVEDVLTGRASIVDAAVLSDGLPLALTAGTEQHVSICPARGQESRLSTAQDGMHEQSTANPACCPPQPVPHAVMRDWSLRVYPISSPPEQTPGSTTSPSNGASASVELVTPPGRGRIVHPSPPPWRHPDAWAAVLVLVVAVGLRVPFFQHAPVYFEGDARGYLVHAVELGTGDGVDFTLKRTPGYSLLIAAVFGITSPSLEAVVAVQHLFGVATALLTYGCAREVAGRMAGLLAALATAASGSMLIYEHAILTESLFTLILVASLWLLIVGLKRMTLSWFVAAGLLAGGGAVVRPVGLTLALVAPILCAGLRRSRIGCVSVGVYLTAAGLALMPWIVHNALVHGEAAPVHPGRFLIERTIKSNQTGVSMYDAPIDPDDPPLVRERQKILREIEPEGPTSYEVHDALTRELDLSDAEASDLMWDLATDAIRREPDAYLFGTWIELAMLVRGQDESVWQHTLDRRSAWKGKEVDDLLEDGTIPDLIPEIWAEQEERVLVAETIAHLYQPSYWIALLILGSALAAIWGARDPSRRSVLVPLGVVAGLVLCTVAINGAYPRYRYPLDPLLHITAAAGLLWTIHAGIAPRFVHRVSGTALGSLARDDAARP